MITKTPADMMNLKTKGTISYGMDADFVVFDDDINIIKVFKNGASL